MSSFKDSDIQDFSVKFGLSLFSEKKKCLSQGWGHPKPPTITQIPTVTQYVTNRRDETYCETSQVRFTTHSSSVAVSGPTVRDSETHKTLLKQQRQEVKLINLLLLLSWWWWWWGWLLQLLLGLSFKTLCFFSVTYILLLLLLYCKTVSQSCSLQTFSVYGEQENQDTDPGGTGKDTVRFSCERYVFSCWKNISLEEKFRISARPCNILYISKPLMTRPPQ